MLTIEPTAYGRSHLSDSSLTITGMILLSNQANISSASDSLISQAVLDTNAVGNFNNHIGNLLLDDGTQNLYTAKSILFYIVKDGTKRLICGCSSNQPIVTKGTKPLTISIPFDFSVFTGDLSFSIVSVANNIALEGIDGLIHIDNPNTSADDDYAVYSKSTIDEYFRAVNSAIADLGGTSADTPSNLVTTDTDQIINGTKTFDSPVLIVGYDTEGSVGIHLSDEKSWLNDTYVAIYSDSSYEPSVDDAYAGFHTNFIISRSSDKNTYIRTAASYDGSTDRYSIHTTLEDGNTYWTIGSSNLTSNITIYGNITNAEYIGTSTHQIAYGYYASPTSQYIRPTVNYSSNAYVDIGRENWKFGTLFTNRVGSELAPIKSLYTETIGSADCKVSIINSTVISATKIYDGSNEHQLLLGPSNDGGNNELALYPSEDDYCYIGTPSNMFYKMCVYFIGDEGHPVDEIYANNFYGNLNGIAEYAVNDENGNEISSYYCTLSTDQSITGKKTFSSTSTFNGSVYLAGYSNNGTKGIRFADNESYMTTQYSCLNGNSGTDYSGLDLHFVVGSNDAFKINNKCTYNSSTSSVTTITTPSVTSAWTVGSATYRLKSIYTSDVNSTTGTFSDTVTADKFRGQSIIPYGKCTSAADAVVKEVTLSPNPIDLANGSIIAILFQYSNTASQPTMSINGTSYTLIANENVASNSGSYVSNHPELSWPNDSIVLFRKSGSWLVKINRDLSYVYNNYASTLTKNGSVTLNSTNSNTAIQLKSGSNSTLSTVYISDIIANALRGYGGYASTATSAYGSIGSIGIFSLSPRAVTIGNVVSGSYLHACTMTISSYTVPASGTGNINKNASVGCSGINSSSMNGSWIILSNVSSTTGLGYVVIAARLY